MTEVTERVAFLMSSLKFGGAERVAISLADEFKKKGFTVDFILMSCEGEFLLEARSKFNVIDLGCNRTWKLPFRLVRYLSRYRAKALISSQWKLSLCACFVKFCAPGVRLVIWEHSPPTRSFPTWLYAITATLAYRVADSIVAVSTGVAEDIYSHTRGLRKKVCVIFNPIPRPTEFKKPGAISNYRRIIWVGRLNNPKNPDLMLDAFALLPRDDGYSLDFLGDGPLRPSLEKRAKELDCDTRVRFLGFKANVYEYLRQADMLVLSSDREGLPTVVVEALQAGLKVVSTDCGKGIHDILPEKQLGLIVPAGDKFLLARAIVTRMNVSHDASRQIVSAQRFNPEVISSQFLKALRF